MRHLLFAPALMFVTSQALAQAPSPAQMGITSTTTPEVLQVLDNNKNWVPIGTVGSGMFVPSNGVPGPPGPPGIGEADILVTDPSVGMAAATATTVTDNAPHISALMNRLGPPQPYISGYDVTFPAVPGQNWTMYYFSKSLVLSRGARYHCSGATGSGSATVLAFAPGVDGVVQEDKKYTPDGGAGMGTIDGCRIVSLGYGTAQANAITPTILTSVAFAGDTQGFTPILPLPTWSVGDGIILASAAGMRMAPEALLVAPIGTTVTNVVGTTLTLSNPISPFHGWSGATAHSSAAFTQTGSNNFTNLDTIQVGDKTYTFVTSVGGQAAYSVLIGANFAASAANLVAMINGAPGEFVTYIPASSGVDGYSQNLKISAAYASGVITFTSIYSGPVTNTFPSVYAGAGTAGTFGGATFAGANDATNCSVPCTAANGGTAFYQLPATQAFKVRTTVGSNSVLVTAGPRLLVPGEVVWSDAFPFGTTTFSVSGTLGNQTVTMLGPGYTTAQNATVAHVAGAEGNLWIMPAGIKRDVAASSSNNFTLQFPIGLTMICNSNFMICNGSRDENNWYQFSLVGRWVAGNTTSANSSISEAFARNFLVEIYEGGTLGEVYVNPNTNSAENGQGKWSYIQNCGNENYSVIFGGYIGGNTFNNPGASCANPISLFPPTVTAGTNSPTLFIGPQSTTMGGPTLKGSGFSGFSPWAFVGGADGKQVLGVSSTPGGLGPFGVSNNVANGTPSFLYLNWSQANGFWDWQWGSGFPMLGYFNTTQGYTGVAGQGQGSGIIMAGLQLGAPESITTLTTNARSIGFSNPAPINNYFVKGDSRFTSFPLAGGAFGWSSILGSAGFTGTITGTSLTMPSVTAGTVAIGQTVGGAGVTVGTKITAGSGLSWTVTPSQTVGPVAMVASSWYPFGPISNDTANPDYTATTIRSGSSSNKDITGRITLAGGTATYTLTGVYATAPVCLTADATTPANASSVSESTTVLTFTGTGTDVIKYECVGRN